MAETRRYDVVVIGSGPAGEKAAMQAAKLRKRVLLIEKEPRIGGSCLHTGTIPSKSLRETVVHLDVLRHRTHGIDVSVRDDISVEELMYRKDVVVGEREQYFHRNLSKNHVDLLHGRPRLVSPTSLEVVREGRAGGEAAPQDVIRVDTQFVVLATGSRPHRPEWVEFDDESVLDSDTVLRIRRVPAKLTIIGAGVIGCEYASIFSHLGIRVNLIAKDREVLPFLDREIAESLTYRMRRSRIAMRLGEEVESIRKVDCDKVSVCLKSGKCLPCSTVLVATGRVSNTDGLGLEGVGVTLGARGRLVVNETFQTSVPNIYAVGDIIGFPALASTAMNQGRIAVLHAFGQLARQKMPSDVPLGVWTIPPVAMVGRTEEQLTAAAVPYEIGVARFGEVARATILGEEEDGLLKVLFDPETRKLLGVHIIGARAPELIHLGQAVLFFGGTIDYFTNATFNYPTLDEAWRIAAFNGLNRLSFDL